MSFRANIVEYYYCAACQFGRVTPSTFLRQFQTPDAFRASMVLFFHVPEIPTDPKFDILQTIQTEIFRGVRAYVHEWAPVCVCVHAHQEGYDVALCSNTVK